MDQEVNIFSAKKKKATDETTRRRKRKIRKDDIEGEATERGVCYISRVPPHMNPSHVRQIFSQYGELDRIYLVPEGKKVEGSSKTGGGFRGKEFSEGWVEFLKKSDAKRVAKLLNGEQIGGKKRSPFYYDMWNIKYLRNFKWDDLVEETAIQNRIREKKLAMELSAANRERDFFLTKIERSQALKHRDERMRKKMKTKGGTEPAEISGPKTTFHVPQKQPVDADGGVKSKPSLSEDILAGVFGGAA